MCMYHQGQTRPTVGHQSTSTIASGSVPLQSRPRVVSRALGALDGRVVMNAIFRHLRHLTRRHIEDRGTRGEEGRNNEYPYRGS